MTAGARARAVTAPRRGPGPAQAQRPMIWMARSRLRGPSSSAAMMAWNWPSTSLPLAHRERQRVAEQRRLQVRVGVLPVAVGELRVVVPPLVLRAHDLVEHGLHVVEQRRLPLVHEQGQRGVQRREQHHALLDVVALDDVRHALGEVVELEPLVRDQAHGLGDHAHGLQAVSAAATAVRCFIALLGRRSGQRGAAP